MATKLTSLVLVMTLFLAGCRETTPQAPSPTETTPSLAASPEPTSSQNPPAPTPAPGPPIRRYDTTNKPVYLLGEPVEVNFLWKNVADEPAKVKPFPLVVEIKDADNNLIWSSPTTTGEYIIKAGETLQHKITWDQRNNSRATVQPGYYFVSVKYQVTSPKTGISSVPRTLKVLVQFAQGAIDKTLRPAQARPLQDGSTFTLEEVVLSTTGARVRAKLITPDYMGPSSDKDRAGFGSARATLRYRLDGGVGRTRQPHAIFDKDYIILEWDLINPVPKGTKYLDFTVEGIKARYRVNNRFPERQWPGPIEFHLQMD